MDIEKRLDALNRIRKVDAPPFLITRIQQRLRSLAQAPAPKEWKWAFAAIAVVVLTLNLIAFSSNDTQQPKNDGLQQVVNAMHLSSSNDLYHE